MYIKKNSLELPKRQLSFKDIGILKIAQLNKYDCILNHLNLKKSNRVLEIGCGWGAFGLRAVEKFKCDWTALTISQEQYQMTKKIIAQNNLNEKIHIKFCDYRYS